MAWHTAKWNREPRIVGSNLKVDIPVTEFRFPADFHAQLYKANEFFVFCENTTPHNTISKWLISDKGKNNYQEYLLDVFELFKHTISDHILKKRNLPPATHGSWMNIASIQVIKRIFVQTGVKVLGFCEITFS